MSRGGIRLTKAEREKQRLLQTADIYRWRLTGTLVPSPRVATIDDVKQRIEDCCAKSVVPKLKYCNGRWVIQFNANIWVEQILPGDGE